MADAVESWLAFKLSLRGGARSCLPCRSLGESWSRPSKGRSKPAPLRDTDGDGGTRISGCPPLKGPIRPAVPAEASATCLHRSSIEQVVRPVPLNPRIVRPRDCRRRVHPGAGFQPAHTGPRRADSSGCGRHPGAARIPTAAFADARQIHGRTFRTRRPATERPVLASPPAAQRTPGRTPIHPCTGKSGASWGEPRPNRRLLARVAPACWLLTCMCIGCRHVCSNMVGRDGA